MEFVCPSLPAQLFYSLRRCIPSCFPPFFCPRSHIGQDISTRSEEHTSELQSRENLVCRRHVAASLSLHDALPISAARGSSNCRPHIRQSRPRPSPSSRYGIRLPIAARPALLQPSSMYTKLLSTFLLSP